MRTPHTLQFTLLSTACFVVALAGCAPEGATDDATGEASAEAVTVQAWRPNTRVAGEATAATPGVLSLHDFGMPQTALVVHRGSSSTNVYIGLVHTSRDEGVTIPANGAFHPLSGIATQSRPVIARRGNILHMIHQGSASNTLYWDTLDLRGVDLSRTGNDGQWYWNRWTETRLNVTSQGSPDLVYDAAHDQLVLTYAEGGALRIRTLSAATNEVWSDASVGAVSYTSGSFAGIATTIWNGELIAYATVDLSRPLQPDVRMVGYRLALPQPGAPSLRIITQIGFPGATQRGPVGLAGYRGVLHIAHRGQSSSNLWWAAASPGVIWSAESQIPAQASGTQPVLTVVGSDLLMLHTGSSDAPMYASRYDEGA